MHTHAHPFTSGLVGAQDPTTSRLSRLQALVVIGDAFQSVCPATGTGLTRVLTDVDVLCNECIPDWLATPGMGPEKIDRFYNHPRKLGTDRRSLTAATYSRQRSTESSVRWEIRRRGIYAATSLRARWHRLNRPDRAS